MNRIANINKYQIVSLAKITPPRLINVLDCDRLYRVPEELREQAPISVSAPTGSGKTTIVASWPKIFDPDLVWYQCDADDADLASSFIVLSLAVTSNDGATSEPLPRLTLELYPKRAW